MGTRDFHQIFVSPWVFRKKCEVASGASTAVSMSGYNLIKQKFSSPRSCFSDFGSQQPPALEKEPSSASLVSVTVESFIDSQFTTDGEKVAAAICTAVLTNSYRSDFKALAEIGSSFESFLETGDGGSPLKDAFLKWRKALTSVPVSANSDAKINMLSGPEDAAAEAKTLVYDKVIAHRKLLVKLYPDPWRSSEEFFKAGGRATQLLQDS